MTQIKKFKVKISKRTKLLHVIVPLGWLLLIVLIFGFGLDKWEVLPKMISMFSVILIVYLLLILKARYEVSRNHITVYAWMIPTAEIEIKKIKLIDRKHRTFEILGMSRDIISIKINELQYKNSTQKSLKEFNLTPVEEKDFIKAILEINPNIELNL